jgi:hypothetical protein
VTLRMYPPHETVIDVELEVPSDQKGCFSALPERLVEPIVAFANRQSGGGRQVTHPRLIAVS